MTNREIDALVAEHAMGWWWGDESHWKRPDYNCILYSPDHPRYKPEFVLSSPLDSPQLLPRMPHYSTDPAASKQLRDKMRELGWQWGIRTAAKGGFHCEIYKLPSTVDVYFESFSATEEMAFALAALPALGVEVPQ